MSDCIGTLQDFVGLHRKGVLFCRTFSKRGVVLSFYVGTAQNFVEKVQDFVVINNSKFCCRKKSARICTFVVAVSYIENMVSNLKSVHFVGIGGIGTSALAEHLLRLGVSVSGSDLQKNSATARLEKQGAKIFVGHSAENVKNAQLVVRTSAVLTDNCEVAFAREAGISVMLREQLLGEIFNAFPVRVAVCGTHGKTTVTAWIHHVLDSCGVPHTAFIGGEYQGHNYFFGENIVVAEACEYNASFLNLRPTVCLCLNAEFDHPDCYSDEKSVHNAFVRLFGQSKHVVLPQKLQNLWPQGEVYDCENFAQSVTMKNGCASFLLSCEGRRFPVQLSVCGMHNVPNALATFAVAKILGLSDKKTIAALQNFHGVDRRWTEKKCKIPVVCDYAHHPTEILAAVSTAKSVCNGKVFCVFQPHTYSRTKAFKSQFVSCFAGADEVVYLPIFPAREQPNGTTSLELFQLAQKQGVAARYCENFSDAANYLLQTVSPNDLVVLVGAGDVDKLADLLK